MEDLKNVTDQTIEYYNTNAKAFAAGTEHADMSMCRERFLQYAGSCEADKRAGIRILDAGCGSGRDSLAFLEAGYSVDAFDASAKLCRIASEKTGLHVRQMRFEELADTDVWQQNTFDGIWACASLLHVPAKDLAPVLQYLAGLLKPDGVLYASFKYGTGERVKDGRFFHDLDEAACEKLCREAGFRIRELFITGDVREGRSDEKWVNVIASNRNRR